jgi:hypothetical protein
MGMILPGFFSLSEFFAFRIAFLSFGEHGAPGRSSGGIETRYPFIFH